MNRFTAKILTVLILGFAFSAKAQTHSFQAPGVGSPEQSGGQRSDDHKVAEPAPPLPQDPALALEGVWQMTSRSCSSGLPVRDSFVWGRDTAELIFQNGSFRTYSEVAACLTNSRGYYEVTDKYLIMDITRQTSTCSPEYFVGRMTYGFIKRADNFTIELGPLPGGSCPQGDFMSITYTRL